MIGVLSEKLGVMIDAARSGGAEALRHYARNEVGPIVEKGPRDYQLAADVETERVIASHLLGAFPDAGIAGEEHSTDRSGRSNRTFIIDPIDGTSNFAFRIPFFAQVISCREGEDIVAGVVFDPLRDELFVAERGKGAMLNGRPLPTLSAPEPEKSVVGTGLPVPGQVRSVPVERYHRAVRAVIDRAAVTRRLGSAALSVAYVAVGRHHAFFEDSLDVLDYGASALIVRECGGIVTDFAGQTQNGNGAVLASVPSLHPWLLGLFGDDGLD